MYFSQQIILFVCLVFGAQHFGRALEVSDFYEYDRSVRLENGDNKFEVIKLDTPINFFSDTYDLIYVSIYERMHGASVGRTKMHCNVNTFVDNDTRM